MHQIHFRWFANRVAAFPRGHRTTVCFGRRAINFISDTSCTNRKLDKSQVPLQIDNGNRSYSTRWFLPPCIRGQAAITHCGNRDPSRSRYGNNRYSGGNVWNWHGFLVFRFRTLPNQWFNKPRALAMGLCAAGSGPGDVLFSLCTNLMIETSHFHITAICILVVNTIVIIVLKD